MEIEFSNHFGYKKLLRFAIPSIAMMIFTSIYSVVDGYFVSNFAGKTAFSALNLIYPAIAVLAALGLMIGTGGSALVAKIMGEGDLKRANRVFSLLVYFALLFGIVFGALGFIFARPIAAFLGASGQMLEDAVLYGRVIFCALPAFILQFAFQSLMVTAGKPKLGFTFNLIAGIANMVLDYLLVGVWEMGLFGAALASDISLCIGGIVPIIYFSRPNKSLLRLGACSIDFKAILKTMANGSSEWVSNISVSIISMLYNIQLLKYLGENGVAAYGVIMYVCYIFLAVFIGYSVGTSPIVSFHYGAQNYPELQSLRKKGINITLVFAVLIFILTRILARPLCELFVGYDRELFDVTYRAYNIFSFIYLVSGIPVFGSSFFTALNNGLISALIAFIRSFIIEASCIMLLPLVFGVDGIWISIVVAEVMATIMTILFLIAKRKKYNY